jgi:hypothetical protein
MSSRKMRRTTATTTKNNNNNRLKDLTNTNNTKEKEQEDRNKRNASSTPEIPDSRPSRMTASIVVEASSSPRCLAGEKKEATTKKKKNTTFPRAGTRRKRVAKAIQKKEDNRDEDFEIDLMCEEEPLVGKRRRKGTGKASNTTRSRSGTISKISSLFFFCICLLSCFLLLFFSLFEFKNFQNRWCLNTRNDEREESI